MTPYDETDHIDENVLAAEIEFCIESRVGGIMSPLMVSEFRSLSEDERKLMMRIPVEVSAGRTPIIVNVAAVNTAIGCAVCGICAENRRRWGYRDATLYT